VTNLGLERNPLKGMKKPQPRSRAQVVLPADFEQILAHATESFRDLLIVSYDSGARPFEIKELESRHVDLDRQRAVIPAGESKGRRHPRTVYFPTARSMEIIRRLCTAHATGPLFRNSRGNKWNGFSVKNAFEDVQVAIGVEEMRRKGVESAVTPEAIAELARTLKKTKKSRLTGREVEKTDAELRSEARTKLVEAEAKKHAGRICHYSLRHSFVTRSLVKGVDSHTVAKLAGHRDTKMLDTVYSHVAEDYEYMLEQAKRTADPEPGNGPSPTPPAQ
jgi:integrase